MSRFEHWQSQNSDLKNIKKFKNQSTESENCADCNNVNVPDNDLSLNYRVSIKL